MSDTATLTRDFSARAGEIVQSLCYNTYRNIISAVVCANEFEPMSHLTLHDTAKPVREGFNKNNYYFHAIFHGGVPPRPTGRD